MFDPHTLRWCEPFGGWGNHADYYSATLKKINQPNDTGLCNRIFHWEIAYEITKKHDYLFNIYLQYKFYPELSLLHFPATIPIYFKKYDFHFLHSHQFEDLHFKTVYDLKNQNVRIADKIDRELLENVLFDELYELKMDDHFYADFGYTTLLLEYEKRGLKYNRKERPLRRIQLKHRYVEEQIKNYVSGFVGIHLRRNNGVKISLDDFEKMDNELKQKYLNLQKTQNVEGKYEFYGDDLYFKIIDKILEINPNQQFYISDDLPDNFINYYKEKYGNNTIKTRDELVYKIETFYFSCGIDINFLENYGNLIKNIIDLFSLSYCDFLIMSPNSTWSEFARDYKDKGYCYVINPIDEIIKKYNQRHIKTVI